MAAVLERHLAGHAFVLGAQVSAADFVVAYTLDWADEAALLGGFPELLAYRDRMYARPHAPRHIRELMAGL